MRFCQTDGTPLVDDTPVVDAEPAFDPYATIVGTKANVIEIAPEEPTTPSVSEPVSAEVEGGEPMIHQTIGSMPIAPPDDVLDLPSNDPLKTMYVSDTEMQAALGTSEQDLVEIPPLEEAPAPEPPSFLTPDPPPTPFSTPPPSPFAAPDEPITASPAYEEPAYDEAATMIQPSFEPPAPAFEPPPSPAFQAVPSAFDTPPAAPVAEWTPPPAPDASWQNQEIGSNTPFQPPPAGVAGGENKTLAIVSLVLGILSCLCCFSVVTGPAALITGFMARKKADEDPAQYGGRGLALGGMITGAIGFLIGVAVIIMQIFFGVLNNLG